MNAIHTNKKLINEQTITDRCMQSCKKLLTGIEQAKNRILDEFSMVAVRKDFQLAMNEAEALAWQTNYPHLLFPSLAMEKIQAVAAWQRRQQFMLQPHLTFAEAA